LPDKGVCIWRKDKPNEFFSNNMIFDKSVEWFLSKEENCNGEWLIDGGWGYPPGPVRVYWEDGFWKTSGFVKQSSED
jgi:hypothetical protein